MMRHLLAELRLTPDQRAKIRAILEPARAAAQQAADHHAKMKILRDAFEKVKAEVLTDEQRKELESLRDRQEGPAAPRGGGRRFNPGAGGNGLAPAPAPGKIPGPGNAGDNGAI
jgi:Spy/CpxP family protein refolding chaperone